MGITNSNSIGQGLALPISTNKNGTEITDNHTGNMYISIEPHLELVQMITSLYRRRLIDNSYIIHPCKAIRTARIVCKDNGHNRCILNITILETHMIVCMNIIDEHNVYSSNWIYERKAENILM